MLTGEKFDDCAGLVISGLFELIHLFDVSGFGLRLGVHVFWEELFIIVNMFC